MVTPARDFSSRTTCFATKSRFFKDEIAFGFLEFFFAHLTDVGFLTVTLANRFCSDRFINFFHSATLYHARTPAARVLSVFLFEFR